MTTRGHDGGSASVISGRTAAAVRSALPKALNDHTVSKERTKSRLLDIQHALHGSGDRQVRKS